MKRKSMMVLFAALLTFGGAVYAQEAETVQEAADTQEADAAGLSDDWKDYQIQIDDQVYSFPMMYEDFTALGWETDESDELSEYQIEVDGQVYALPVPVSVLAADGWEIDVKNSEETIKAGSSGWVTLRKGGQEIRDLAYNGERYATIPENCWIEEIALGKHETNVPGQLPGGIATGMSEADFLAALEEAGVSYEAEESGDYTYYSYNNPEYGRGMEVTVYTGDDGYFEKDTIMTISCSNELE